jgi:serine/threonine protein kinase
LKSIDVWTKDAPPPTAEDNNVDINSVRMISHQMLAETPGMARGLQEEVRLQRLVASDHIVRMYEGYWKANGDYAIVTESMPDGLLASKVLDGAGLQKGLEIRDTIRQLVDGVRSCHQHDVVHLDLTLEHMWCKGNDVKIGDFSLAMEVKGKTMLSTVPGTLGYMAPELACRYLMASPDTDTPLDLKAIDMWALGVSFYVLLAGRMPWRTSLEFLGRFDEMKLNDHYIALPANVDRDAEDLIQDMLQMDPSKRYTIEQVASHKYFTLPSRSIAVQGVVGQVLQTFNFVGSWSPTRKAEPTAR